MKTVLLYLLTPLLTFSVGAGSSHLISRLTREAAPIVVEMRTEVAPAVAPIPAPVETPIPFVPQPTLILDYPSDAFGILGGFSLIGPKPKDFPYFDFIEVALPGHDQDHYISVYESDSDTIYSYEASFALVTQRRLFFVTSEDPRSGYGYRFDGEFVRTDFDNIVGKKKVALRGTLTKTKDGRTVAEATVSLWIYSIGC